MESGGEGSGLSKPQAVCWGVGGTDGPDGGTTVPLTVWVCHSPQTLAVAALSQAQLPLFRLICVSWETVSLLVLLRL